MLATQLRPPRSPRICPEPPEIKALSRRFGCPSMLSLAKGVREEFAVRPVPVKDLGDRRAAQAAAPGQRSDG
jgi:hypothetical protein